MATGAGTAERRASATRENARESAPRMTRTMGLLHEFRPDADLPGESRDILRRQRCTGKQEGSMGGYVRSVKDTATGHGETQGVFRTETVNHREMFLLLQMQPEC